MTIRSKAYNQLPASIQPSVKEAYRRIHPGRQSSRDIEHSKRVFIQRHFDSELEYESYVGELTDGPAANFLTEALETASTHRDIEEPSNRYFQSVYAYVRKTRPEYIVETGVRDGWSTLYILAALIENNQGTLHSIDYPIRDGDDAAEFQRQAPSYQDMKPAIPKGTDPGWIVPEKLRDRWYLFTGKSQEEMPQLFDSINEIDIFIHDSDHSLPCMIFEYELAWEWFGSEGIIFSDDITWNSAFEEFACNKNCDWGRISHSFGYLAKSL